MSDVANLNIVIGANVTQAEQGLNSVSQKLGQTALAATKVDSSIGKSSQTFQNLGRVIQDLPYGFQGIQNNLTQLIPSAGLLGIAFTAVITAINFSQIGFANWTRRSREAKEATDKFAESLRNAESGALATGLKLTAFANIARDTTKSLQERNYALEQANKLMGEHGEKLTLVNINTAAATEEINKFTQALIQQAVAAKYADKAADLVIKQREAATKLDKALKDLGLTTAQYNKEASDQIKNDTYGALYSLGQKNKATKAAIEATQDYVDATSDLSKTTKDLNSTTEQASRLLSELGEKPDVKKIKKSKEAIDEFGIALNNLRHLLFKFGETPINPPQVAQIKEIITPLSQIEAEAQLIKMRDALRAAGKKVFSNQGILSDVDLLNADEVGKNFNRVFGQMTEVAHELAGAFESIFDALLNGESVFNALGGALKQFISKLVAAVVEAAILRAVLSFIPGGAVAGPGFLGQILGLLGAVPKGAAGGVVTSPTLMLVGEAGPERISPLSQLTGSSNNAVEGEVIFTISGQNLRGVLKRADSSANTFQ